MVPAIAVWAAIGLVLTVLPVAAAARVGVVLYGCGYGAIEALGATRPRAPGRNWQVPQDLMIGASARRRVLIWGSILGPGFLTRNPYAGFGMLPLLAGAATGRSLVTGAAVAAIVGATHACGRGVALLRDVAAPPPPPVAVLLRSLRWRRLDGVVLLAISGVAIATTAVRL